MRTPISLVLGTSALFTLNTLALGSTWSVRLDSSTAYGSTIDRVASGGVVASIPYRNGGVLIAGVNEYSDLVWHNLLSLPAGSSGSSAVVRASADGGYLVATTFYPPPGPSVAWLGKLDAAGNILWQRTWSGGKGYAAAEDLVALSDGGCLFVGDLFAGGAEELWVTRLDASGATVWSETIDTPGTDVGGRARLLGNGDFVLAAISFNASTARTSGLVFRLTPDGSIVWQRSLDGPTAIMPLALATTASGEILVGGSRGNGGQGNGQSGALLIRLSGEGALLGSRLYRGPLEINGIAATGDGRIALAGNTYDVSGRFRQFDDGFVIVTDSTGAPVAATTHGGPGLDGLLAIADSGDGGFVVAGFGSPSTELGPQAIVEKLDATGSVGTNCARIAARAIDVDSRPITVRPASAVVVPFTPAASPLGLTNRVVDLAWDLICIAP